MIKALIEALGILGLIYVFGIVSPYYPITDWTLAFLFLFGYAFVKNKG